MIKLVGDFETTVYDSQEFTEVWASAVVEIGTENVQIFHSIADTWNYLKALDDNIVIYYHNLKFDGQFWLYYFKEVLHMEEDFDGAKFAKKSDLRGGRFTYLISDRGSWYNIVVKHNHHTIEFRDSLKLLPFSVKQIGKGFDTKHKKLDMEYTGYRYSGCIITDEEKEYIKNDVLVVAEALEIMFNEGHDKLTIGACCLSEYKQTVKNSRLETYQKLFPDLTSFELNENKWGSKNADEYIRKSYRGGWCYLKEGEENKEVYNGLTADVNSLYPSVMHSESGSRYPIMNPHFVKGEIPKHVYKVDNKTGQRNKYFFVRLKARFEIKKNYLPFIQIRNSLLYPPRKSLKTSKVYNFIDNSYEDYYVNSEGKLELAKPELTLTETDYFLFHEHYNVYDEEILDCCWFWCDTGIFDEYINTYRDKKINAKTKSERQIAKLYLNNLYGKMATSTNSSFKLAYTDVETETVKFKDVREFDKKAGYIAIGSAITSYAREFTIRASQKNYKHFVYADTDSMHLKDIKPNEVKGIKVHDKNFCCWKLESYWDKGIFARQKTYIERVTHEDGEEVEPYNNIKCAGMPSRSKELLNAKLTGVYNGDYNKLSKNEKDFIKNTCNFTDFRVGLKVPGKLVPKTIKGGVVLTETDFTMR